MISVFINLRKDCNVASDVIVDSSRNDSAHRERSAEKISPAPGTNQIAGFVEFRPLTHWEINK